MLPLASRRRLVVAFVLMAAFAPFGAAGQAAPRLLLESVVVEPRTAAPDTLCHLSARIRNGGEQTASSFAFRVELDGRELGVYRDHLFMDPIRPGETRALSLFSFWTNETGRPLPESARMVVELQLEGARWMKEERDADGILVWSDLGAVENLPQTARFTLEITK